MSETVHCGNDACDVTAHVKLKGTLPKKWFAKWYAYGDMPRCCSSACMRVVDDKRAKRTIPLFRR